MVNRKNKKSKPPARKIVPARRQQLVVRKGLDGPALNYARLLADPCAAPLAHPIYPGTEAGFLFRAESFLTWGTTAGSTAGVFHWTPGYVNTTNSELLLQEVASGSTAAVMLPASASPGKTFLAANAKGLRCVAACVKVTYPGAESTRSGRLHYGHTSAGMLDASNSVTPDNVAQTLQHYSRTPAETVELVWKPSIADTEFNDPSESASPLIRDRKSSLTVAFAGLPATTGLTFHLTAVYEWTPAVGLGVGNNTLGKARSINTLDEVADSLIARGFTFVRHVGMHAGSSMANGMMNAVAQTFGLMPTGGRSRSVRSIAY